MALLLRPCLQIVLSSACLALHHLHHRLSSSGSLCCAHANTHAAAADTRYDVDPKLCQRFQDGTRNRDVTWFGGIEEGYTWSLAQMDRIERKLVLTLTASVCRRASSLYRSVQRNCAAQHEGGLKSARMHRRTCRAACTVHRLRVF